eukprot:3886312-Amphidinium_carterae.2
MSVQLYYADTLQHFTRTGDLVDTPQTLMVKGCDGSMDNSIKELVCKSHDRIRFVLQRQWHARVDECANRIAYHPMCWSPLPT